MLSSTSSTFQSDMSLHQQQQQQQQTHRQRHAHESAAAVELAEVRGPAGDAQDPACMQLLLGCRADCHTQKHPLHVQGATFPIPRPPAGPQSTSRFPSASRPHSWPGHPQWRVGCTGRQLRALPGPGRGCGRLGTGRMSSKTPPALSLYALPHAQSTHSQLHDIRLPPGAGAA
jgi:hypothetical protein